MLKKIISLILSYVLVSSSAFGAMITPDGKTNTTVNVNGNISDVHTSTVSGNTGFNSFNNFDVYSGHTANLYLPDGTKNLINLVHDKASNIDGVLNAFKDGKIGGNIFFLNPNGIAIGAGGIVNVGALTLATPTKEFMDNVISADRTVSSQLTKAILAGDMPINPLGLISVKGKINAAYGAGIFGGNIVNSGNIKTNFDIGDIVNLGNKNLDGEVLVKDGRVLIVAKNDFVNDGIITADAAAGKNAADINIKAGGDIKLNSGSISASGYGENSNGGNVILWADGKSIFNKGASLLAKAGKSGDGGFIEFSAKKLVDLAGGIFDASSYLGKRGSVLIDPENITISEDFLSAGADYTLNADNSITLKNGKKIVTSKAGADAGNVSLTGKNITLENNSSIDASAGKDKKAGDITLTAKDFSDGYMVKSNSASINIGDGVSLKGKNITLEAHADNTRLFDDDSVAATVGEHTIGELGDTTLFGGTVISDVNSSINIGKNAKFEAAENIDISSKASADASMRAIGSAVSAVYGESNVDSKVDIKEGANISAGGNINISSKADSSLDISAISMSTANTPVPADGALAIGKMTVDNNINLAAGSSISGNEVSIDASTDKYMSVTSTSGAYDDGYAAAAVSYSKSIVNNGIDSSSDIKSSGKTTLSSSINSTKNKSGASAGTGTSTIVGIPLKGLHWAHDKIGSWVKKKDVKTNNQSNVKIGLSAALSYSDQNNTSVTKAGGNIKSGSDIEVKSSVTDAEIRQSANASVDSKGGGHEKDNAVAGAVSIAEYNNNSTAYIADDANIDAKGSIDVTSSVSVPFEITWHKIEGVSDIIEKLNGNFGLQNGFFTTWAKSDVSTNEGEELGKFGLAGAVNISDFNSDSKAYIGKNARINKDPDYKSGAQSLNVKSNVDISTLNMAGIWGVTGAGTKSKVGLGGSYQQIGYDSTSSATIKDGADIDTNNLEVSSDIEQQNISTTEAGGKSETFGFEGAFGWLKSDTNSTASVSKDAKVSIEGADSGKVIISAKDNIDMFNIAGGVTKTQNVGIGTSVSLSDITRNTSAFIGDVYDASKPVERTKSGYFKSDKSIEISAENTGDIYAYSLAGVIQNDKKEKPEEDSDLGYDYEANASQSKGDGGKFGVGISGDVSYNNIEGSSSAYINGADIIAGKSLDITSKDDSWINSVAGAASLILGKGTSVGFAGSASTNFVRDNASSFINNSSVLMSDTAPVSKAADGKGIPTGGWELNISSESGAEIIAVAASGSLANPSSKGVSLAGSVTVNDVENNTSSYIKGSDIISAASDSALKEGVSLSALDNSKITSVAGALGIAGTVGIGSSVGVNEISNTTESYLEDSLVSSEKDINLSAENDSSITNVEGSVGAGKDGMALAASIAVNEIGNTTKSYIKGGSALSNSGSFSASAKDSSNMTAVAGEISGAGKAAFGASTAVSTIKNDVYSYAQSAILSAGNIDFDSSSDYTLKTAAAGGAGSEYASITGSVAVNNIETNTEAYSIASSMTAAGSAGFRAKTNNEINFYGGTIDGAAGAGIGGTVIVNNVSDNAYAAVKDGSKINAYGQTALSGTSDKGLLISSEVNDDINSWVFNLSGGGAAVAATVDVTGVDNTSKAEILNSDINQASSNSGDLSGQNIKVKAINKADAEIYGGSLAGGGAGVGAVSDTIRMNNTTNAGIEGSKISAKGNINVNTDTLERYNSILISGAGGSAGLAGNVAVAMLNNENNAYIKDSIVSNDANSEVSAKDTVELGRKDGKDFAVAVGALAGGAVAGIGGSVLVSNVKNNTKSFIVDSSVNTGKTLKVRAESKQDIVSYLPAASLGGSVGLAASVGVNTIDSNTEAYINENAGTTIINADASKSSSEQDVEVSAESSARIHNTIAAAGGAGLAGVGAGIGVSTINGKVAAGIGSGTEVNAARNIKIESTNTRTIDDMAVAAAIGGLGAANGSVLVANIGSNLDSDSKEATDGVQGTLNEQLSANSNITKESFGRGGLLDYTAENMEGFIADVNDAFTDKVLSDKGTSAYIGTNAIVKSGNKTEVLANDYIKTNLTSGGAGIGGMLSVGASVAIANIDTSTKAFIGDNSEVSSKGGLNIEANSEVLDSDIKAILGQGSITYALGAAVAKMNSNNNTLAYLSDYVRIIDSGAVNINAAGKADMHAQTVGAVAGGVVAAGASVASVEKGGNTSAYSGEEVSVDNTASLNFNSSTDSDIFAEAEAGAGGILAGVGTDADAVIKDKLLAKIGKKNIIKTSGETGAVTGGQAKANAKTYGVDVGALAVGVSLADSEIKLDNKAEIDRESTINAGSVKVTADQKKAETLSDAFAASGALIGGAGATATSKISGEVLANIHSKSNISALNGITFKSKSITDQTAKSTFYGGAVISAGANESDIVSDVAVKTVLNDGLDIEASKLEISSDGSDKLYAKAVSGSGGIISGSAAIADTKNTSNSKVEIGVGESENGSEILNNNITAAEVNLKAVNATRQDSEVDSRNGGIIHSGGAIANNTSDMNVSVDLKDRTSGSNNITASHFKVEALNNYNKDIVSGANVYSGSGGAIDVPITESTTKINNYTDIIFGNNNNITTVSDSDNNSSFLVNALNNIKGDDKVFLKSGGLIVVPIVKSEIDNSNNKASVTVNSANIKAADDIVFNTKADVDIAAGSDLNIYGGISVAAGKSLAKTVINNNINLNSGARLASGGDVYFTLSQPKTESGSAFDNTGRAYIKASGITNVWNTTALAFNADSQAKGDIYLNNNVNINSGASVRSDRNININGVKALMSATGLLDLTSPLGDLAASDKSTSVETQEVTNVKIDGELLSGVHNTIDLTIDGNRNITLNGGTLPGYTISKEMLSNNIMTEIEKLRVLKAQYSVSEVSAAAYQAEINRLQSELAALGQVDSNGLIIEVPVDFITFDNIRANMGDISINADNITGSGKLSAPASAKVKIHNSSDLFVRFNDVTIDNTSTGSIYYNGALVKNADEIALANATEKNVALSEVSSSGGLSAGKPSIEIVSDYSYQNRAPNLEFLGDVLNDNGDITIYSSGSIQAKGNMRGQTIHMDAANKIVQSYVSDSFLHVGGNPYGYWSDVAAGSEAGKTNTSLDSAARGGGSSIKGNNVFLSASYLDINGLIQSGNKDLNLNISDNFTLSSNGLTFNSIEAAVQDYQARKNRHEANVNELYAINNSGSIQAFFNVLENRIELKDVKIDGGKLELFGNILNTGGAAGELKVLDGYGRINVVNNSSYDLFLNSLDASSKVEGVIKITDTARKDATGNFMETIYQRVGDNLLIVNSDTRDANGKANNISKTIQGGRETSYSPVTGQRYYWNTGKERIKETTYKKENNSFWGMDFLVPDDSYEKTNTRYLQDHSLYEGEFVKTGSNNSAYSYTFEDKDVVIYDKDGRPVVDGNGNPVPYKSYDKRWTTTSGWWIFSTKTNHHEVKYEEGHKEINTHSIKADYPVKITFDGYDSSALDINSAKSNIILNGLINNSSGDVNITAAGGAIKSNSNDSYIKGQSINLNAKNGIGGDNYINVEVLGGAVNANTGEGDIKLASVMASDFVFNNISTGKGKVDIKSERSIYGFNDSSLIKADDVSMKADLGSIGSGNNPLILETRHLSASAQDDINIKNTSSGDLGINAVESKSGDIAIETEGNIYDENKNEIIDQRSKDELLNDWKALDLMDSDGAGWTEDQLSYKIDAASLDNKVSTQYMIEDPNIKGKTVTVKAGGSIGQDSGSESFNISDFKSLSDEKKLMIASAERDNIIFSEDGKTLTVLKREDIDIHADKINLSANGFIYLGAEQDINVGSIEAKNNVTIAGAGGIYNVVESEMPNIKADNLTLEASKGAIGSAEKALNVALTGKINARSSGDTYLKSAGDMAVDYLFAQGTANIETDGALTDARSDDMVNIRAYGINLDAASIGNNSSALGIALEQNEEGINALKINTSGDVNISNTEANPLYIAGFTSGGNIKAVSKGGDILNASEDNIIKSGGDIDFVCVGCDIGSASNKLNIDAAGLISAEADGNIYINSTGAASSLGNIISGKDIDIYSAAADIVLNGEVKAENGRAGLTSASSIYSFGGGSVLARSINLNAEGGAIGAEDNPLKVEGSLTGASSLTAKAAKGIYLAGFTNGLRISRINSAGGDISIIADEDIKVNDIGGDVNITGNNIKLHSNNGIIGAADDMIVVDVNNEGGLVNAMSADGIYLKQLKNTFNSDYIRNTRSGDIMLEVPNNDVNIKDVQKQGSFNVMLTGKTYANDISIAMRDMKRIISDAVYTRIPTSELPAKLKIFERDMPHVSYKDEPARME